jgi:hypothetical protein
VFADATPQQGRRHQSIASFALQLVQQGDHDTFFASEPVTNVRYVIDGQVSARTPRNDARNYRKASSIRHDRAPSRDGAGQRLRGRVDLHTDGA